MGVYRRHRTEQNQWVSFSRSLSVSTQNYLNRQVELGHELGHKSAVIWGCADNDPHKEQDAAPLRALRIDQINTANVLSVLRPIWNTKHETAARLRAGLSACLMPPKPKGCAVV